MRKEGVYALWPNVYLHVLDSGHPGPTALIQGAIHGDEIAGAYAIEELIEAGIRPERGRLLLIPVMNPPAFRARSRTAPGGFDLNRAFPGSAEDPRVEFRLADRFVKLMDEERPDLMATLHESWKRHHPELRVSFGQTITYGVEARPPIIDRVLERMNAELEAPYERWAPHYFPVATSSTEVLVARYGEEKLTGLCIETWMGFELERRVAMQKHIVTYLLEDIGLLS